MIACALNSEELYRRKATVIADLKTRMLNRLEIDNGYSYVFTDDDGTLDKLIEFVKAERKCCPFFIFNIGISESVITLTVTGPTGAKQFLDDLVNL